MARPVTLFTGQWADLKLELLCRKAKLFGYDGLELACWGDHFEVEKADATYCRQKRELLEQHGLKLFSISSHLVGQALRTLHYEYCLNACGLSGWIHRGDDGENGDVPGYYTFTKSTSGVGGQYDDAGSRWNKIDSNHSLLDSQGHISANGQTG